MIPFTGTREQEYMGIGAPSKNGLLVLRHGTALCPATIGVLNVVEYYSQC
jgi:hypothetical protein